MDNQSTHSFKRNVAIWDLGGYNCPSLALDPSRTVCVLQKSLGIRNVCAVVADDPGVLLNKDRSIASATKQLPNMRSIWSASVLLPSVLTGVVAAGDWRSKVAV